MKAFQRVCTGCGAIVLIGRMVWACGGGGAPGAGGQAGSGGSGGTGGSDWPVFVCGDGLCEIDAEGGEDWHSCPQDCCYECACLDVYEGCADVCTGGGKADLCNGAAALPECAACVESKCGMAADQCAGNVCESAAPTEPLACAQEIALGEWHACARATDGSLWCWGRNDYGQLASPGSPCAEPSPLPVKDFQKNVVEVALGLEHTCARMADRTVFCWGRNSYYQTGGDSPLSTYTPVEVTPLGASVVEIVAGADHNCARKTMTDGSVWCWGNNYDRQLGTWTIGAQSMMPVEVTALGTDTVAMAAGSAHTCARKTDGRVWCWGNNSYGQIGIGSNISPQPPVEVTALGTNAVQLAAGDGYTCARMADGSVSCWGRNNSGQLGDGTSGPFNLAMVQVTALGTSAVEIAAGSNHACARMADGSVWCWGGNTFGQLGKGTTVVQSSPVQMTALGTSAVRIFAGGQNTCARKADGSVWCWGRNTYGQVGDGTTDTPKASPVQVAPPCP